MPLRAGFFNHVKGKLTDGQVSLVYFVTGKTPGKYHAEISDKSCLQSGCHATEDLTDERSFKGVSFSHPNHLKEMRRGKKLRCTTCHGQIVQGAHLTVDEKECFICHFKPTETGERHPVLADCRTCHTEVPLELDVDGRVFPHERYVADGVECTTCHVDIIQGDGALIENKCVECHNEPFVTDQYSAESLHLNHVTNHKVECWRCHREIKHEVVRTPTTHDFKAKCSTCHDEQKHLGPREMYAGTGGIGVEDSPSMMYRANVDCASCHVRKLEDRYLLHGVDYRELALGEACNRCHGPGYDSMLLHWKEVLTREESETSRRVFEAQKALFDAKDRADDARLREAERLIAEARHNLNFVILGRGHHNIEYAVKLLNVADERTERAKSVLIEGYTPQSTGSVPYSCTTLCHTEMETRTVKLGDVEYPHRTHIRDLGLSCTDCHGSMEKHGQTSLTLCKDCHHGEGEGKVQCTDCHQEVADLYRGVGAYRVEGKPSVKSGTLDCADCHTQVTAGEETTRKRLAAGCVECHDERYADMLTAWEKQVADAQAGLAERVATAGAMVTREDKAGASTLKARNLLVRIRRNQTMIEGERGVHNPGYAAAIAEENKKMLDEIERLMISE